MRILLTVAYDGTNYFGWQRQKGDPAPTVEQKLEEACEKIFQKPTKIIGASRTDRGVHAEGQRAVFDYDGKIPAERIAAALNANLPPDIAVRAAKKTADNFHPRFDCVKKTYLYNIYNAEYRNPLYARHCDFVYKKLDEKAMNEAAAYLVGRRDFKAFCASGNSSSTTVRTIFSADVTRRGELIQISLTGDGFLYNMVRIIAGTLTEIGAGKRSPQSLEETILSLDRTKAGKTAAPNGLVLKEIFY